VKKALENVGVKLKGAKSYFSFFSHRPSQQWLTLLRSFITL